MSVLLARVSIFSVFVLTVSASQASGQLPAPTSVSSASNTGAGQNQKVEKPVVSTDDSKRPPVKPKREDFATLAAYEEARDKYYEDLTDYKVTQAVAEAEKRTEAKIRESESVKVREQLLAEREAEKQRADALERRLAALEGATKTQGADASQNQTQATGAGQDQTQASAAKAVKEDADEEEKIESKAKKQDLSWSKGDFRITLFGAVRLDAYYETARTQGPGMPVFLVPKFANGFSQHNFAMNARNSMVGLLFTGPDIGGFHSGGKIQAVFVDNTNIFADRNGFMLTQAYGELYNDKWRFAAGLQLDVFAPNLPTALPFTVDGSPIGNTIKGQVRAERYLKFADDFQLTLQGALSEPLNSIKTPDISFDEDNGKPNFEGRVAFGLGTPSRIGMFNQRALEIGFSGVVGELRRTSLPDEPARRVVSTVWGVNLDFHATFASRYGLKGEVYTGKGLGQMAGTILQSLDAVTWKAIRSTGGWVEGYVYFTPVIHNHTGVMIDDVNENDMTAIPNTLFGRTYNRVFFNTLLWDLGGETKKFRVGVEFTWRRTKYKDPDATGRFPNSGFGIHPQFQWLF